MLLKRFRAGLVHSLLTLTLETGDTYVEARELLQATIQLLEASRPVELDPASIAQELASLIEEDKVQNIDTKIFNNSLFFAEEGIRSHIVRLLEKGQRESFELEKIEETIDDIEEGSPDPLRSHAKKSHSRSYSAEGLYPYWWTGNREDNCY